MQQNRLCIAGVKHTGALALGAEVERDLRLEAVHLVLLAVHQHLAERGGGGWEWVSEGVSEGVKE